MVAKSCFHNDFSLIKSRTFKYILRVFGIFGRKPLKVDDVLSSHEQKVYPTIWIDRNCIDIEFQKDQNYCVESRQSYTTSELKLVRSHDYETYNSKNIQKGHKEETKKTAGDEEMEEDAPVPLVTPVNNTCTQFFPTLRCTSTISKLSNEMDSMRASFTFPVTSREPSLKTRICLKSFIGEWKWLSEPDGSMLYGRPGIDFFHFWLTIFKWTLAYELSEEFVRRTLSLPRTSWRPTETGAELYFSSRTRYWTPWIGGTNVYGCSWQPWCCWKDYLKGILIVVSRCSSISTLVHLSLTRFQLWTRTLFLLSTRNPAIYRVSIGSWLQSFVMKCFF